MTELVSGLWPIAEKEIGHQEGENEAANENHPHADSEAGHEKYHEGVGNQRHIDPPTAQVERVSGDREQAPICDRQRNRANEPNKKQNATSETFLTGGENGFLLNGIF